MHERLLRFFLFLVGLSGRLRYYLLRRWVSWSRHFSCLRLPRFEGLSLWGKASLTLAPSFSMVVSIMGIELASSRAPGTAGSSKGWFEFSNQF